MEEEQIYPWQPIPPISFYKKILDNENNIRFVVEKRDDPLLKKLIDIYKNKNIIIQSKDFLSDFLTLMNSKKLVLSIFTFSWWAAFLSNATEIHIPQGGFFIQILLEKI